MTVTTLDILVHETKEEVEYDRRRVIATYETLQREIKRGWGTGARWDSQGYGYARDDDAKVVELFELTKESTLGDMLFGSVGDFDQGSELIKRVTDL
jgi:hypothetical protein